MLRQHTEPPRASMSEARARRGEAREDGRYMSTVQHISPLLSVLPAALRSAAKRLCSLTQALAGRHTHRLATVLVDACDRRVDRERRHEDAVADNEASRNHGEHHERALCPAVAAEQAAGLGTRAAGREGIVGKWLVCPAGRAVSRQQSLGRRMHRYVLCARTRRAGRQDRWRAGRQVGGQAEYRRASRRKARRHSTGRRQAGEHAVSRQTTGRQGRRTQTTGRRARRE
eukprot:213943-Chlamydomonas_euryale.AAC.2